MSMKDRTGTYDIRAGDHIDTDQRPDPVLVIEIIEDQGVVRFVDDEGVEGIGRPGRYLYKFKPWAVNVPYVIGDKVEIRVPDTRWLSRLKAAITGKPAPTIRAVVVVTQTNSDQLSDQ